MLLQRSRLAAARLERPRLIAPWAIAAVMAVVAAALAFMFPFETLVRSVVVANRGDELTVSYLHNLLRTNPANAELRLTLARQQMAQNRAADAEATLEPLLSGADAQARRDAKWLIWSAHEREMLGLPADSSERSASLAALRADLRDLAQEQWGEQEQIEIARKAGAYGALQVASQMFDALNTGSRELGASWFDASAREALARGDYDLATRLHLIARERAETRNERRAQFLAALRVLQSANRNLDALALAERELGDLGDDIETLYYLVGLARAANRPDLAESYAKRMLKLSLLEQWRKARAPERYAARLRLAAANEDEMRQPPSNGPQLPFDDRVYTLGYEAFLGNRNLEDAFRVADSAVRQAPDNAAWRERLARVAEWSGRPSVALAQWRWLAERHNSEEAWQAILRLAPGLFDDETLLPAVERELRRNPRDMRLLDQVIALHERLGQPREAIALLAEFERTRPSADLLERLAKLSERVGDDDAAIDYLLELTRRDGVSVERAEQLAALMLARKRPEEALAQLRAAAAAAGPGDAAFWRLYAQLGAMLQDDADALAAYRRVLEQSDATIYDYDAVIALQSDDRVQAARLAEAAWQRFGSTRHLLQAAGLYAADNRWREVGRLFDGLDAQARVRLEADVEFLRLRATWAQNEGRPRDALRDVERALALAPADIHLRESLLWMVIDGNDATALRRLLLRVESQWSREPALHDALAGAYLTLSQPQIALERYLSPRVRAHRGDFLWLMNYADALEQNGESDRAWRLREHLWTGQAWRAPRQRAASGIDDSTLDAVRRVARARLALAQRPSDASLALLREVLRLDRSEGKVERFSPPVRELVIGWHLNAGENAAVKGRLWQQYGADLARPLWAQVSAALADDDRADLALLLEQSGERLPRYDRVNAARRIGDTRTAQSYALDSMLYSQRDDESQHLQLTESMFDFSDSTGVAAASRRIGSLDERELGVDLTVAIAPDLKLALELASISRSNLDTTVLGSVPGTERRLDAQLAWRHGPNGENGETRLRLGAHDAAETYQPVELSHTQVFGPRLSATVALGWSLPSAESTALRAAGKKDRRSLQLVYSLSRLDRFTVDFSTDDYATQSGVALGRGRSLGFEYTHLLRSELPDLLFGAFWSDYRYSAPGGLEDADTLQGLSPLLPSASRMLLQQLRSGTLPAGVTESTATDQLATATLGLAPSSFRLYGVRLSTNVRLREDYTRGWRPYASVALLHNSTQGFGYDTSFGIAGSLFGADHLFVGAGFNRGGSGSYSSSRELGLAYRLNF